MMLTEAFYQLGIVDDNRQALGERSNDLFLKELASAPFDQVQAWIDLVGSIKRPIDPVLPRADQFNTRLDRCIEQ